MSEVVFSLWMCRVLIFLFIRDFITTWEVLLQSLTLLATLSWLAKAFIQSIGHLSLAALAEVHQNVASQCAKWHEIISDHLEHGNSPIPVQRSWTLCMFIIDICHSFSITHFWISLFGKFLLLDNASSIGFLGKSLSAYASCAYLPFILRHC